MTFKRLMLCLVLIVVGAVLTMPAFGAGLREAAVVIRDEAPIFDDSEGSDTIGNGRKGEIVAYITGKLASGGTLMRTEKQGRVKVVFIRGEDPQWGMWREGWMNPSDLSSSFTYDCECSRKRGCTPLTDHPSRLRAFSWTVCLQQAGAAHAQAALAAESASSATPGASAGKCTVDQILKMKEAGLDDAQIKAACGG